MRLTHAPKLALPCATPTTQAALARSPAHHPEAYRSASRASPHDEISGCDGLHTAPSTGCDAVPMLASRRLSQSAKVHNRQHSCHAWDGAQRAACTCSSLGLVQNVHACIAVPLARAIGLPVTRPIGVLHIPLFDAVAARPTILGGDLLWILSSATVLPLARRLRRRGRRRRCGRWRRRRRGRQ